ncbi:hypothetical protein B4096_0472 [Heyndrickxia coagulans]|nr:hypothetical protein B4096_0472 [Heyndrickxia coagulans]
MPGDYMKTDSLRLVSNDHRLLKPANDPLLYFLNGRPAQS